MLMLKSTHDAVVTAKDEEIAEARALQNEWFFKWQAANAGCFYRDDEIADLRARLAVFTAPRARNAKGHFLPTKGGEA